MIYVVSYDLQFDLLRNTAPFLQELQSTEGERTWWHYLNNTWLISTRETAQDLFNRLQPHLRASDRLLIMRVGPDYSGFLPQDAWNWIRQQVTNGAFRSPMDAVYAGGVYGGG